MNIKEGYCPKISVVIPMYNAVCTIKRCLDSVVTQTVSDLEIICVDDGSLDDSIQVCEEYALRDKRIKVISKKNGGVASARNEGLKQAKGIFVTFIDQDDWIENDAYEIMMQSAEKNDADMVVCNYTKDTNNYIQKIENIQEIPVITFSKKELIRYAFQREVYRGFAAWVWNKLFRRQFIIDNNILFDETLKRGDDILFYSKVANVVPKTVYIDKNLYHYVQRNDSITHTYSKENLERLMDILKGYKKSIQIFDSDYSITDAVDYMKCFFVYHASFLYEIVQKLQVETLLELLRQDMLLYLDEYKKCNQFNVERIKRIDRLVFCTSESGKE